MSRDPKQALLDLAADMHRASAAWERIANAFERIVKIAEDDFNDPHRPGRPAKPGQAAGGGQTS